MVLVSFELRSSAVKDAFLGAAAHGFSRVERLGKGGPPRGWQGEHIELYKLQI